MQIKILLRHLRVDKGISLKEMAEQLGVSSAFLSAIENGKKQMPENLMKKICEIFKIDRLSLMNAVLRSRKKITVDLSVLTSEDREKILDILLKYERR